MPDIYDYGFDARFESEAAAYPELEAARVVAQHRGSYTVATKQGEFPAEISGKFRYSASELQLFPAVGDYVMASVADGRAVIRRVLPRKSAFERTAVGVTGQSQVVAANVDTVFLCMSLNNNFNLSRLERYLSIAWDSGAQPVVLLTKADACEDLAEKTAEAKRAAGFADVAVTSAFDGETRDRVLAYIPKGATASFIGSSGVGKSTLINKLMGGGSLATAETGKLDKGRHTTTSREMLILPNGGIVIDTPGMRELGVESADLSKTFSDIEALEAGCRFSDCTHTGEPGCAVRAALEDGTLDQRRLASYNKLKREAKYDGLDSRQIEAEKLGGMFKDVGGMKNVRKYIRQNDKRGGENR